MSRPQAQARPQTQAPAWTLTPARTLTQPAPRRQAQPQAPVRRRTAALLAVGALLLVTPAQAKPKPQLAPKLAEAEAFGETYSLVVDLGPHGYLQAQVVISNLGPGSAKGACRVMLLGRHAVNDEVTVDRDKWSYDRASDTLKVGPCQLWTAGDGLWLTAPLPKARLSVHLFGAVHPVRPPDGRLKADGAFYEVSVLESGVKAAVRMQKPGEPAVQLSGFGYADHSRSTVLPSDIARRWVRFRALDPSHRLVALVRFPPKGGAAQGWLWTGNKPARFLAARTRKKAGRWQLQLKPRTGAPILITSATLLRRHAPVEEHGLLGRIASTVVGNPVTYTYRAEARRPGEAPIPGIMEVTIVDE